MRRDWQYIQTLLDVVEKLAGHPNLKTLRDEANEDLNDVLTQKPYPADNVNEYGYPEEVPHDPLPGHVQDPIDHDQPKDTKLYPELIGGGPASNPTGENTSDPVVRRKLP